MSQPRTALSLLLALGAVLALGPRAAAASPPTFSLEQTLLNPNPEDGDQFGYSVSLAGNSVLIGAPFATMGQTNSGAAYLFDGAAGTLLQTFVKQQPAAGDWLGISVANVGNDALVGALGDDTGAMDAGAAFLFDDATGALLHMIQEPTPHQADWFGGAVAAAGSNLLVGAPVDHIGGVDGGGAYLFDPAGHFLQSFHKPKPASGEWFGVSLAAAGNDILVGAFLDRSVAKDAGAVYLFDATSGALLRTFQKPKPAAEDQFGVSLAVMGNTVLVGAPGDSTSQKSAGAVYAFDIGTGKLLLTLRNPAPVAGEQFGRAVAAFGADILVGAPADGMTQPGAAYLFDGTTGALLQRFQNLTPAAGDGFGFAVAADPGHFLIAAPGDKTAPNDGGAAYLYGP